MIAYIRKCIDSTQSIDAEKFFFLPPPHKKNIERYFHDNNGGCASSALRFHQCREGKNKS
jgi:hypothetical protein